MSDMTQSFIEMVEAFKAKPELEAKIATLEADNGICYQTIELKRTQLEQAEARIAELTFKLGEVTRERDDAMFRSLELDEKLSGIEKLLGVAERLESARRDEHQATVDAMTPKPEPVPVPLSSMESSGDAGLPSEQTGPIDPVVVEGQSAENPLKESENFTFGLNTPMSSEGAGPDSRPINPYSGFPVHYPDGEYKGQPCYDKPSWVSWAAWVDAGGEAEPHMKNFV